MRANILRLPLFRMPAVVYLAGLIALYTPPLRATTITVTATDLIDIAIFPGVDRWQFEYRISRRTFAKDEGFTIYFEGGSYSALSSPSIPLHTDWDTLLIQPDPILHTAGFFDGLAVLANPSIPDSFIVTFDWLGSGTPPAQRFEIYQSDPFRIIEQGTTTVWQVPDNAPSSLLLGIAFIGLVGVRWFGSKSQSFNRPLFSL